MTHIQQNIFLAKEAIKVGTDANPTASIQQMWERKEIELVSKYDERVVAMYWPDFYSVDSALFVRKNKHVPALPKKIEDLKDLPDH